MNRVYKVVWCHVRNTYVVASELASSKKKSGKLNISVKALAVVIGLTLSTASVSAQNSDTFLDDQTLASESLMTDWKGSAAYWQGRFSPFDVPFGERMREFYKKHPNIILSDDKQVVIEVKPAKVNSVGSMAFGRGAFAGHNPKDNYSGAALNAIAMGSFSLSTGYSSIAIGKDSLAAGNNTVVIGAGAESGVRGAFTKKMKMGQFTMNLLLMLQVQ